MPTCRSPRLGGRLPHRLRKYCYHIRICAEHYCHAFSFSPTRHAQVVPAGEHYGK